ncbi:MAG: HXXEE domain-containing protein [candidate division Zixibacteria bacterium]|nr:HXXEE domain-containing protein [candidate division Zixibacteria bacterium]
MTNGKRHINKNATAWIMMVSALAVHVFDEAVTGFLSFYNPLVLDLKQNLGFFPMPTFTFPIWLGGLIAVIMLCFLLTPLVKIGGRFIRVFAIALSTIMIANGLGHMLGSVYFGKLLPGFWSSPLLLASAIYMAIRGLKSFKKFLDYKT